jgi:hypothetical protein
VVNQIPGNPVNGVQSNPSFRPTVDTTVTLNGYPSIKFVGGFTGQSFAFPTGVGRPVVDMMRKENLDPQPKPVTTMTSSNDSPSAEPSPQPTTLPPLPADAATQKYVLALIKGRLKWFPML